jgi:hypothetical protein
VAVRAGGVAAFRQASDATSSNNGMKARFMNAPSYRSRERAIVAASARLLPASELATGGASGVLGGFGHVVRGMNVGRLMA